MNSTENRTSGKRGCSVCVPKGRESGKAPFPVALRGRRRSRGFASRLPTSTFSRGQALLGSAAASPPRLSRAYGLSNFATAEQALEEAARFDLLIIDAPARASKATEQIARAASLIIQPTTLALMILNPP